MDHTTFVSRDDFENAYYRMELKNGILFCEYKSGLEIGYEDARKIVADRLSYFGALTYPVLIRSRKIINLDRDARKYLFTEGMKNFKALALIENSPLEKVLAHALLKLYPLTVPYHISLNEDAATKWLKQHL